MSTTTTNNEDRQSAHSDSHVIRFNQQPPPPPSSKLMHNNSNNRKNNDFSSLQSSNYHHHYGVTGQQSVTLLIGGNNSGNNNMSNNTNTSSSTNTISTSNTTTAKSSSPINMINMTNNNNINGNSNGQPNTNKKHNIGFRLRRLFFGSNQNLPSMSKSKNSTTIKDSEVGENKNFIKHNPSLHSNSSESSSNNNNTEHKSDSRRKRTSNLAQRKTDVWSAAVNNWHTSSLYNSNSNNNNNVNNNNSNVASLSLSSNNQNSYECSICLLEQPLFQYPELKTCHHRACINCLRQYLRIEIYESRINITCLQCQELMHPNDIKAILKNDMVLIEKYESFMVRRTLITDPDARWCPAPDCDYCVIATGCASCPMLKCERPGCETLFCYHCKQEWHPNQTCDQARAQRGLNKSVFISSTNPNKSNVTFTSTRGADFSQANASTSIDSFVQRDDIKPCPCCKVLIIKMNDGSCNHMTCSVCGTEFCWLCMQKISDLHYLSPSGCTFWGKKPWSRKKKIMWQLGMLVGAPVGIALIAGIAVPAIIIGIPVWVGRKLYSRFERNHMSRHKSNFLVTAGVMTSIFVSPILAAVAVGIGVPILLAYVYGVVPISLCRSSGCGVSTSSSGVRIELDEDEISAPDGVSVDTALSGRAVTNPSIGEVSLGMSASLSIGSSSHLDRVVLDIQPDRESSSIAACAGSITSNYLNHHQNHNGQMAQMAQTSGGGGQKLETLADINSSNMGNNSNNQNIQNNHHSNGGKRLSLSSQNADSSSVTLSFGERSVNTNPSLIDEASLKAHTGSLLEAPTNSINVNTVEVHITNEDDDDGDEEEKSNADQCTMVKNSNDSDSKSQPGCSNEAKKEAQQQGAMNFLLNKFESRSMEYLSNNYCNICHKSHKPCCPNFQHPSSYSIKIVNVKKSAKKSNSIQSSDQNRKEEQDDKSSSSGDFIKSPNDDTDQKQQVSEIKSFRQTDNNDDDNNNSKKDDADGRNNDTNNNGQGQPRTTLTKKALSQIFYPSQYMQQDLNHGNDNNNNSSSSNSRNNDGKKNINNNNMEKIHKSSLSHSLSFGTYGNGSNF